ncbi:hypothetical protein B9Z55_021522 [Caenorhabditis nigoni]|uniref:Uncharacterized protein n=1 Tax=Caenorhabditis nigoni TaxID=1611254 RepID=A0A2G5TSG8_9PELO|nr:hypothetical protein B9Z55_021522 [Caenorhabditis nigoni]
MDWNCEVSCGNGSSSMTIQGQLLNQRRFDKEEYGTDREQRPIFESIGTHLANAVSTVFGELPQMALQYFGDFSGLPDNS